jgi:hypothetical protein
MSLPKNSSGYQKYNISTVNYNSGGVITRDTPMNGFTVTNIGDTAAMVNGMLIGPAIPPAVVGDSISIGGNENEQFVGHLTLSFVIPLGANPLVEVVQKFFITQSDYK